MTLTRSSSSWPAVSVKLTTYGFSFIDTSRPCPSYTRPRFALGKKFSTYDEMRVVFPAVSSPTRTNLMTGVDLRRWRPLAWALRRWMKGRDLSEGLVRVDGVGEVTPYTAL